MQLFLAVINNDEAHIAELLLSGADIEGRDDNGDSILHVAWNMHCRELIPFLIKKGADVSAQDTFGVTLLHLAAPEGDAWLTTYLMENGASVFVVDKDGCTPLHKAVIASLSVQKGSEDEEALLKTIIALLDAGKIDLLEALDKQGKNVLEYVAKQPGSALAQLFHHYKAKEASFKQ